MPDELPDGFYLVNLKLIKMFTFNIIVFINIDFYENHIYGVLKLKLL